jgi:hypothetical protein
VTLTERWEMAQLGQEIEEACRRAVHRAMREVAESPPELDLSDEAMSRLFVELEALRPHESV